MSIKKQGVYIIKLLFLRLLIISTFNLVYAEELIFKDMMNN